MRRFALAINLLATVGFFGCEEGPKQTYAPSPTGAANQWNDGKTPAASDSASAKAGYTVVSAGANKQELCPGDKKAARWADMVKEPIKPPTTGGGLDLSGGSSWTGLTIEQAEVINCQSSNAGDQFGNGTLVNYWGDNGELWMDYRVSTRKANWLNFWPGYIGTADFKSEDGQHTYSIGVQVQIKKDGMPFNLDWTDNAKFAKEADELVRALINTYSPGLLDKGSPASPAPTCIASGKCIKGSFGDPAYLYVPALGWALWIDNQNAAQPTPSIPTRLDQDLAKVLPFSTANPILKLDQEGPVTQAVNLGKAPAPCVLKIGMTYADLINNCVAVTGDNTADTDEKNKILGGLSHGAEHFRFDVQGVDVNFLDTALGPTDVIRDSDVPHPADTAAAFHVDQSTLGLLINDRDVNSMPPNKRDLHGYGAVLKEYSRIVRQDLLAAAGITDQPTKLDKCVFPVGWEADPNFDPNAFIAALPPYCTGFEGMITPAPPTKVGDTVNLGYAAAIHLFSGFATGLKPGHQKVVFCMDANGDAVNSYANCNAPYGAQGDTFSTSFGQALKIFGKGKLANMPTDAQDVRFFFKAWVKAFIKYLTVGGQTPVPNLSTIKLDPNNLFFDSIGAGQFEIAEYVDRRFCTKTQNPTDITITADVKNGIFADYDFGRDLRRGEEAIYAGMTENQNDALGSEDTALLSNIFGSPVLAAGWVSSSAGKSAYYCATNNDPNNCDGQMPPVDAQGNLLVDELGRPLLAPYHGAFGGQTTFALGKSKIKILQTFADIQQALIKIPTYVNPYDPTSSPLTPITVLIPWLPKQPGVGFPVALTGTLDKFVQTAQIDFSGETITANVDYDQTIDPMTHQPDGTITLKAVETTDFLGDVFLCQDPATTDLLVARMYTPVANLLNWFQAHPGAYAQCQMIIRYSPYGNYADYITSLSAGVRLGITQGGGYGRVVDVTLFTPGQ